MASAAHHHPAAQGEGARRHRRHGPDGAERHADTSDPSRSPHRRPPSHAADRRHRSAASRFTAKSGQRLDAHRDHPERRRGSPARGLRPGGRSHQGSLGTVARASARRLALHPAGQDGCLAGGQPPRTHESSSIAAGAGEAAAIDAALPIAQADAGIAGVERGMRSQEFMQGRGFTHDAAMRHADRQLASSHAGARPPRPATHADRAPLSRRRPEAGG